MPLSYHPEFEKITRKLPGLPAVPRHDIAAKREVVSGTFGAALKATCMPPDVAEHVYTVESSDGCPIAVHHFAKPNAKRGPAIYHIHGGGFISLEIPYWRSYIAMLASRTGLQVFSVEHRLAPEHPFPIPLEDSYTGLVWLQNNAATFDIDPARIAVWGESAGATLSVAIAIVARDRGLHPPIKKQILIYPSLSDRIMTADPAIESLVTWTTEENITAWTAYLGLPTSADVGSPAHSARNISPYAAPDRVGSVEEFPSMYMDLGALDAFRDESIVFAKRLVDANIKTEFHLHPRLPHGFEILASATKVVQRVWMDRLGAVHAL